MVQVSSLDTELSLLELTPYIHYKKLCTHLQLDSKQEREMERYFYKYSQ